MELNAVQQFRPPSNRSFTITQNPGHGLQLMYPYGSMPQQHQQQHQHQHQQHPQQQQQQSHLLQQPSPQPQQPSPQPHQSQPHQQPPQQPQQMRPVSQSMNPWTMGHTAAAYQQQPGGMMIKQESPRNQMPQTDATPEITYSQAPAMNAQAYRDLASSQPPSIQSDVFQSSLMDTNSWAQKTCEDLGIPNMDPDVHDFSHGYPGTDGDSNIIDLRNFHNHEHENEHPAMNHTGSRRMSESSFSMSSTGALPELSSYEDMSASEAMSYASDCEPWNEMQPGNNHMMSPAHSPMRLHNESFRRSRASPSPHGSMRTSPYTIDNNRLKRWSTGTYGPTSTPVGTSRNISQVSDRFATYGNRLNPHHSMPAYPPSTMNNFQWHTQNILFSQPHPLQSSNPGVFASPDQPYHLEVPRPVPSQGLFRLLHSNADRHTGLHSHFADLSDPPDLYSSLHEEPSNPPESDMHPSDPDLVPHEQDLRFAGDLYTPRWVRGHGNKREGWCGLCKPGRWLVLKNSAFWYDKSFTHGVSAATGAAFQGPQETRRAEGNLDLWEGLCGSCGEWIALVSSKKKGTTWFRHAYKCHTHQKVKDGPKRRRETSHQMRARAVSSASQPSSYPVGKESSHELLPPHDSSSSDLTDGVITPKTEPSTAPSSVINETPPQPELVGISGLAGVQTVLAGMI